MSNKRTIFIIALSGIMLFPFSAYSNNSPITDINGQSQGQGQGQNQPIVQNPAAQNTEQDRDNRTKFVQAPFEKGLGFLQNNSVVDNPKSAQSLTYVTGSETDTGDYLIAVEDEDDKLYFNRYIDGSDLTAVTTDLDTIDTYTYIYKGRRFTNKIVKP